MESLHLLATHDFCGRSIFSRIFDHYQRVFIAENIAEIARKSKLTERKEQSLINEILKITLNLWNPIFKNLPQIPQNCREILSNTVNRASRALSHVS